MERKIILYALLTLYTILLFASNRMGRWSGDDFFIISIPTLIVLAMIIDCMLDKSGVKGF